LAEIINIEDIELAKLCARGDEKARHELYTRYAAYLFALDGVLDRTTDAYIRRNYPQFRLKFGVEF
jgi:hypothetical protein